ncbi:hypothetical protein PBI_SHIFA_15 [Mycobacterium phage Shifa]|uniref:Uncharacterized protein n=2 Tax=Bixzunavirus hyro TaxID=2006136 RepID=A0A7M1CR99_9CAUD|nr:hypothetical protein HYRO_16 [Mycobacterium phage HyRo]ALA48210.1 hypothetical protein HYRO_16 [Mycobacterium phage HyRo]QOP66891.1 hypothetical protein PBI_SHIFA_15 [Mycobacterium phage Shifa]
MIYAATTEDGYTSVLVMGDEPAYTRDDWETYHVSYGLGLCNGKLDPEFVIPLQVTVRAGLRGKANTKRRRTAPGNDAVTALRLVMGLINEQ